MVEIPSNIYCLSVDDDRMVGLKGADLELGNWFEQRERELHVYARERERLFELKVETVAC